MSPGEPTTRSPTPQGACTARPADAVCALCGAGPPDGNVRWYCPTVTLDDDPSEATLDDGRPADTGGPVPGYAVRSVLGSGGMGVVYLAERTATGEVVALKLLTNTNSALHAKRFQRECELLSRVDIDGAVRVVEHGVHGSPWLAMEWIQGPDLGTVLERNPDLPPGECVRIVREVAITVGRLHDVGLVHRDLKPSNIVLRPNGRPVLVDFGLTRDLEASTTQLTRRPIGTPAYMAPELLKSEDVDWIRADVYSLGAVLARALLGRVPKGDWDLQGIPRPWRAVVRQALCTQPDRRHASAHALARALVSPDRRRQLGIGLLVTLAATALAGTCALPEPGRPAVASLLAPWKSAVERRPDDADEVFDALIQELDTDTRSAAWIGRAAHLDTPSAWGAAWMNATERDRADVLDGLIDSLWQEEDFAALDALIAAYPASIDARPDRDRLRGWVDAFHLRIDDALESLPPDYAADLRAFRETRTIGDLSPLPTHRGWRCNARRCEAADGAVFEPEGRFWAIPWQGQLFAWERGFVHDLDGPGEGCSIPEAYNQFQATGWNGRLHLVSKDPAPQLVRLDPTTCDLEIHPDHQAWDGSYVHSAAPWDLDGDGVDELAVLLGAPFDYELRVYDVEDRLVDALLVGAAREMTVWNGALVVVSEKPHGNAVLFEDMPPVGAHRIVHGPDGLELTHSWPGAFRDLEAADLDGDGVSTLFLARGDDRFLVLPTPDTEPLQLAGFHLPYPVQLDDDAASELVMQRPDQTHIVVGDGGSPPASMPRPAPREPTGDESVDRALELADLGLHGVAAHALAIEALRRHPVDAPWRTVAGLHTEAGNAPEAIAAWVEDARAGNTTSWTPAIEASLREGDIDTANALAMESGHAWSGFPAVSEESFEASPAWALRTPLARWNPERGLLQVQSAGGAGTIARLPLRQTADLAGLQVDLTIDQLDFAGDVWIRLVDAEGRGPFARVHAFGSRHAIHRTITPQKWELWDNPDPDPFGPHRQVVTLALSGTGASRQLVFRNVEPDGSTDRRQIPAPRSGPFVALEIEVQGPVGALSDLSLHSLTLWGLEPTGASDALPDAPGLEQALAATRMRVSPVMEPLDPSDPDALRRVHQTLALSWVMHRSLSRQGERLRHLPGIDQPAVWQAYPPLALLHADARLTGGDAEGALQVLQALDAPDACARVQVLTVAALQALHRPTEAALDALDACGAPDAQVKTLAWSLNVEL